ncbi:peptide MFS transporter [Legionella israelensis]|nr:oligopeptide:H+ symporter [Legionella israelensis]
MSILNRRKMLWSSMPEGMVPLFFIQIVATLSFSVLYSTLVLFMKGKLGLKPSSANSIMGVFVAFNYGLHLLGGYWGGRLFSNRALFCIGMVAQIIGCIFLSFSSQDFLYYGLAAYLTGAGLNVTCLNCMLTQRFKPEDSRRETAFLWNYSGMNIGFFVGFTMSGYFQLTENYQRLFLLSSIGNLIALLICLYYWHLLDDRHTAYSCKNKKAQKRSVMAGLMMVILLPFALSHMLHHAEWANRLVLLTCAAMLYVICWLAFRQKNKEDRNKMLAFSMLMGAGIIFWMMYQLAPMGLTHFIDHNVQRQFGSLIIPPQWFQNINTITIVIGGPLIGSLMLHMRARGIKINIPSQFAVALFLMAMAFIILPLGINRANAQGLVNPGWVVLCYFLQSVGELLISPIGYAMIGLLAPVSLQGIMMGMWMLGTGVGATLSSYSSNWMTAGFETVEPLLTNSSYSYVFMILALFTLMASFLLFILIPKLKTLMKEKQDDTIAEVDLATV